MVRLPILSNPIHGQHADTVAFSQRKRECALFSFGQQSPALQLQPSSAQKGISLRRSGKCIRRKTLLVGEIHCDPSSVVTLQLSDRAFPLTMNILQTLDRDRSERRRGSRLNQ
jgi:hypothetical protein